MPQLKNIYMVWSLGVLRDAFVDSEFVGFCIVDCRVEL